MADEKRLIDANSLKAKAFPSDTLGEDLVVWASDIDEAPTMDAVEVVHGQWKNISGNMVKVGDCSNCKTRQPCSGPLFRAKYCRECGANMEWENL